MGVPTRAPRITVSTTFWNWGSPSGLPLQQENQEEPAHETSRLSVAERGVNPPSLLDFGSVGRYVALTFGAPAEGGAMSGLGEVVGALADRADVAAVVVVSGDGLPIQHAGRRALDAE